MSRPASALAVEALLAGDGYAVVPLLSAADVADLRAGYHALTDESGFGCRPSTISPDPAFRRSARDRVRAVLARAVAPLLPEHRCVVAAYVPKEAGPETAMALHQDWSMCDEERWAPLEVWAPLTPAAPADGGLVVVPGSHRGAAPRRGPGMAMVAGAGRGGEASPQPLAVPLGSGVVFHPALVHGSGPNTGADLRLAVISTFLPRAAAVEHHRARPDGSVATYAVDDEFWVSAPHPDDPPPGVPVSSSSG